MDTTIIQTSGAYLGTAFQNVSNQIVSLLPKVLLAVVILLAGWVVAATIAEVISRIVKSLKVDAALKSAGVGELVGRAGYELDSGSFLGGLVKIFIIIIFFLTSLEVVGLSQVTVLLGNLVMQILPNLLVVVVLIFAAAIIAEAARKFVAATAKASGVPSAGFLGQMTKAAIWLFAILLSLIQFQIGATTLNTIFLGVVVALSLAFGLAFGLGGKDVAGKLLDKWVSRFE
ncbi:MAG: Small-conductance mechanosensitive ion channel-like protein [Parcubacteria group bacterium GW2011_GWF2_38_76]|nr:MAG: Small-conductance mechanosensitive ion channel-like protein [Parcubacteria group bacterium GW2011_GWF2_38_76]